RSAFGVPWGRSCPDGRNKGQGQWPVSSVATRRVLSGALGAVPSWIDSEGDDVVAPLVIDLDVAARGDHDVLLAVDRIGGRRRVDAGARLELPENGSGLRVIGFEV